MSSQAGSRIETYCQAWIGSLALLLSRLTSSEWQVQAAAAPGEYVPVVSLQTTVAGGVTGRQWLSFAAADLGRLLGTFLGEEVSIIGELDEVQKEATEELIRQWCGLAATALKPDFGEVTLQVAMEPVVHGAAGSARLFQASNETGSIAALVEMDEGLANRIEQTDAGPDPRVEPAVSTPAPDAPSSLPPSPSAKTSSGIEELLRQGNLELLMDVELAVMLRFGSRQATLREVLDLATGAVLELDREVQEPVDLVLNGKVIARGEVVVVDGNYGMRVLEVASAQQRVSSL
jgi:flagellar motor switch protein FliN/FliY